MTDITAAQMGIGGCAKGEARLAGAKWPTPRMTAGGVAKKAKGGLLTDKGMPLPNWKAGPSAVATKDDTPTPEWDAAIDAAAKLAVHSLGPHRDMQKFDTGATRDSDTDKLDYEGFLSPLVIKRYAQYMHKHRVQADGSLRDSDNWQKGIPLWKYMKSFWRHFWDTWFLHREGNRGEEIEDALCGDIFNSSGYLHEILKEKKPCDTE